MALTPDENGHVGTNPVCNFATEVSPFEVRLSRVVMKAERNVLAAFADQAHAWVLSLVSTVSCQPGLWVPSELPSYCIADAPDTKLGWDQDFTEAVLQLGTGGVEVPGTHIAGSSQSEQETYIVAMMLESSHVRHNDT